MMEGEKEDNCTTWILGEKGKNLPFPSQAERVGGVQIKPTKKDQTDLKVQVDISRRSLLPGKKPSWPMGVLWISKWYREESGLLFALSLLSAHVGLLDSH